MNKVGMTEDEKKELARIDKRTGEIGRLLTHLGQNHTQANIRQMLKLIEERRQLDIDQLKIKQRIIWRASE